MKVYSMLLDYLLEMQPVTSWPELQALVKRASSRKPRHWQLPALACEAVGGTPTQAVAAAAIACMHISIILIDDMLDADPKGEHQRLGQPATANLAAALEAAGLQAIVQSGQGPQTQLLAMACLNQMAFTTALGQAWDVQNPEDEESYWRVVRAKSAPFFGAALAVGALLGGGTEEISRDIQQLGRLYGEMVQIHDDLHDAMEVPANPDWLLGRSPLPILFAQLVPHPE